jgi:carbonic anhydrase
MLPRLFPVFCVLTLLVAGCGGSDDTSESAATSSDTATAQSSDAAMASWSYEGDTGPENWADLSEAYDACDGSSQSPINLTDASPPRNPRSMELSYALAKGDVDDTGHSIQVSLSDAGTLTYGGKTYTLKQFHAHTPSEHTLNGASFPGEIHLVHQAGSDLLVLGVFVKESTTSNPILQGWIAGTDTTYSLRSERLLPDQRQYYTYEGSLTTPPCSEGVRWIVMETPILASREQLETLQAQYESNARPVQPLGDRRLSYVE